MPVISESERDGFRALKAVLAYHDTYELLRRPRPTDADTSAPTETTVSTGDCTLRSLGSGDERQTADQLGWTAAYAINLPYEVEIDSVTDRIRVNGDRTFEIGAVSKGGFLAVDQVLIVRERGGA